MIHNVESNKLYSSHLPASTFILSLLLLYLCYQVKKPELGHFTKAGVPPKRKLWEFRVTPDALLPVGTQLRASHFMPGQFVDVCGIT